MTNAPNLWYSYVFYYISEELARRLQDEENSQVAERAEEQQPQRPGAPTASTSRGATGSPGRNQSGTSSSSTQKTKNVRNFYVNVRDIISTTSIFAIFKRFFSISVYHLVKLSMSAGQRTIPKKEIKQKLDIYIYQESLLKERYLHFQNLQLRPSNAGDTMN